MREKLFTRRIGEVNLFEVQGPFINSSAKSLSGEMNRFLAKQPAPGLLLNVKQADRIDEAGAEMLLEILRKQDKKGVWGHNLSAYFIAEHMNPEEAVPFFEKFHEAVSFFGPELAQGGDRVKEKRRFPRVRTALPVTLSFPEQDETFSLDVIVTNLSRGGFYAYYPDAQAEALARRLLNPLDLKMIQVQLVLDRNHKILAEGKFLRSEKEFPESTGLAVEFYTLKPGDREKIEQWVEAKP